MDSLIYNKILDKDRNEIVFHFNPLMISGVHDDPKEDDKYKTFFIVTTSGTYKAIGEKFDFLKKLDDKLNNLIPKNYDTTRNI